LRAEITRRIACWRTPRVLQWGRTFLRAEILTDRRCSVRRRASFNGAARFCVRKFDVDGAYAAEATQLQWGRTFLRAEIFRR